MDTGMDLDTTSELEEKRGMKRKSRGDAISSTPSVSVYFRAAFNPKILVPRDKQRVHWYTFPLKLDTCPDPNPNPNPYEDSFSSDEEFVDQYRTDNTQFANSQLEPFSKTNECAYSVAVGLGSCIFVLGANTDDTFPGLNAKVDQIPSRRVSVFDTAESNPQWKEAAFMIRPRLHFCAVVQDEKIFVMGGFYYQRLRENLLDTSLVEYYDPSTRKWQLLPLVNLNGEEIPLYSLLNPYNRAEFAFQYTMTPLGQHELVFSSNYSSSYVYNIRDNTVKEMKEINNGGIFEFFPSARTEQEPPIVLGNTRYFVNWGESQLYGYRLDKFSWVKSSCAPIISFREYKRDFRIDYHALLRVDGSSVAAQGNRYYALWLHRYHQINKEIMCKSFVVSHDIKTPEPNLQAPFELLDVRTTPSISHFIPLYDRLLGGLLLDGWSYCKE